MTAIKQQAYIILRCHSVCAVVCLLNVVRCRVCERYFELPPPLRGWPTRTGPNPCAEGDAAADGQDVPQRVSVQDQGNRDSGVRLWKHRIDSTLSLRMQAMEAAASKAATAAQRTVRGAFVRAGRVLEQARGRREHRWTDRAVESRHGGSEGDDRVCKEHGATTAKRTR